MKQAYRAVFTNPNGLRLTVFFYHENWNGIEEAARQAIDAEHDKYAPWRMTAIDRSA